MFQSSIQLVASTIRQYVIDEIPLFSAFAGFLNGPRLFFYTPIHLQHLAHHVPQFPFDSYSTDKV
jgi:hypothetical protein